MKINTCHLRARRFLPGLVALAVLLGLCVSTIASAQTGSNVIRDPRQVLIWADSASRGGEVLRKELEALQVEVDALRSLAVDVDSRSIRKRLVRRADNLADQIRSIRQRLDQTLPPAAFAQVDWQGWQVVVPVPTAPVIVPEPILEEDVNAMPPRDFRELLNAVEGESFDKTKITLLQTAATDQFFSTDQVAQVLETFSFDSNKLDAARVLVPRLVDYDRAFRLLSSMSFDSGKEDMRALIETSRP